MKDVYLQNSIHFLIVGYKSDDYQRIAFLTKKPTKQNPQIEDLCNIEDWWRNTWNTILQ